MNKRERFFAAVRGEKVDRPPVTAWVHFLSDHLSGEQTAALLQKIAPGRCLVVIEHDMAFVRMIAQKVTVLHQGKTLAEGTMDEIQSDERVIDVYLGH